MLKELWGDQGVGDKMRCGMVEPKKVLRCVAECREVCGEEGVFDGVSTDQWVDTLSEKITTSKKWMQRSGMLFWRKGECCDERS